MWKCATLLHWRSETNFAHKSYHPWGLGRSFRLNVSSKLTKNHIHTRTSEKSSKSCKSKRIVGDKRHLWKLLGWVLSEHCSSFCDFRSPLTCPGDIYILWADVRNLIGRYPDFDEQMSQKSDEHMSNERVIHKHLCMAVTQPGQSSIKCGISSQRNICHFFGS